MKVKQYYPAFYDERSFERTEHEVRSKEELLALPFLKDWGSDPGFTKWWYNNDGYLLAVLGKGRGTTWYVVATLSPSEDEHPEGWFERPPWER